MVLVLGSAGAQQQVRETLFAEHALTGVRIVGGKAELPSEGHWVVAEPFEAREGLVEAFTDPQEHFDADLSGGDRRGRLADRRAMHGRRDALRPLALG